MYILDEELLSEFFLHFPKKNKKDDENREIIDELKDDIEKIMNEIDDSQPAQFYNKYKKIISFCTNLILNFVQYGAIMGPLVIPFTIFMSLLTKVIKKSIKNIKNEADKNFLIERIKFFIDNLTKIRNKNPKLANKIDSTIDLLNKLLNKLLED